MGTVQYLIIIENKKSNTEDSFTVMSYNVRLFNVYKWIDNKNIKNEIVDYINTVQPNILCLQEFYAPNELPNIQLPYQHIACKVKKSNGEWLHTLVFLSSIKEQ